MPLRIRVDPCGGEDYSPPDFIKARAGPTVKPDWESTLNEDGETEPQAIYMPIVDTSDLIGRTFMTDQEGGIKHRARIVELIEAHEDKTLHQSERIKFVCSMNDDDYEEILSYNEIMNHIEAAEDDDVLWKFKKLIGHEGPLTKESPNWKGSSYNVRVEWENGEITDEPLAAIAADDPVTCAIYARESDLLNSPGWKRFKSIAKRQKKMFRMANQAKLRSFRLAPRYKFGYEIPKNFKHAAEIDERMGQPDGQNQLNLRWNSFMSMTPS